MALRRPWVRYCAIATAAGTGTGLVLYGSKTRRFKDPTDPSVPQFARPLPPTREEALKQLLEASDPTKPLDVLVVGGGATGTGIAYDLASRGGLSIGLIEANDFASETSSRSSKLIHGGVRYLEKAVFGLDPMQLKLVFEALKERAVLCHQAPFLVHPIETLIPCYTPYDLGLFWCGMKTYDLIAALGGGVIGGLSGFRLPITTLNQYPQLKHLREGSTLLGSITYYDGQHWDARLCLHVALTAGCYGAAVVNHCRLARLESERSGDASKPVLHRCIVKDAITGTEHTIYAKTLVNATGPFSDSVREMLDADHKPLVRPSHGTHITLPAKYAPKDRAMLIPSSDGRVLFCISYQGHCIAGTTDVETTVQEAPRAPEADIDFILNNMKPVLGTIDRSEVLSTWCGIRPLAVPEATGGKAAANSQSIVREHSINVNQNNRTLSITGGKWTTYRKMAEDVVHTLMDKELIDTKRMRVTSRRAPTEDILLFGAQKLGDKASADVRANVSAKVIDHWRNTYGDQYEVLYMMALESSKDREAGYFSLEADTPISGQKEDQSKMLLPSSKLTQLCPSLPVLDVDVTYSARVESCERAQDFIARRSGMAFLNVKETREAISRIVDLMGKEKKWSTARKQQEMADAIAYLNTFTALAA